MTVLGQSIAEALPGLRAEAESAMPDTGVVTRPGAPTFNPGTGLTTTGAGTVIYTGACRLRMPAAVETNVMFGEQDVTTTRYVVVVPWHVDDVAIGDVVTLTASDDVLALTRSYRVIAVSSETYPVLRKLGCEVVEESS